MNRTRWVFGAAGVAGLVVLVVPAVGQGRAVPASLAGAASRSRSGSSARIGHVYWVDGSALRESTGSVNKVPLSGGTVTTLASGQSNPQSVAVVGRHVYWANCVSAGTVNEVRIGGGSVTTLASGQKYPCAVAVDGTHVYWANLGDGTVKKVPLGGGHVTTLASHQALPRSGGGPRHACLLGQLPRRDR